MRRRAYLGAVVAVGTGGCVGDLPVIGSESPSEEFMAELRAFNVDVERFTVEQRRWVLEYYPDQVGPENVADSVAKVAAAYRTAAPTEEQAPDHRLLDITSLRPGGAVIGYLTIRDSWAIAVRHGTLTEAEYMDKIATTVTYP